MNSRYIYSLTNLEFLGSQITEYQGVGWRRDTIRFNYKSVVCTLQQVPNYKEIVEELEKTNGAAVTATLTMENREEEFMQNSADKLADSICELLAFAKKNTILWVSRETVSNSDIVENFYSRSLFGRAQNFHTGWAIIQDWVSTSKGMRPELELFLSSTITLYHDQLATKLHTALLWINEAEHFRFVDLKFISLFIGIERLKNDFLPRTVDSYIHSEWKSMLNGQLAQDILAEIERKTGSLTKEQKKFIISKLKSADYPPATADLETLCKHLGVPIVENDMRTLRNKLMHNASYGNFDFKKVVNLQAKLSHIVDLCILKILQYDGYYCHHETGWQNVLL